MTIVPMPQLPGTSGSPNVSAQALLANVPQGIDPEELMHLQNAAGVLSAHVNQGQLSFDDAMDSMKSMLQSVAKTTSNGVRASQPSAPLPSAAAPAESAAPTLPPPAPPRTAPSPTGRTFAEIQASGRYQNVAEREWYLNQINRTIGRNGLPVPRPAGLPTRNAPHAAAPPMFGSTSTSSSSPLPSTPMAQGSPVHISDDGSAAVPDYVHGGSVTLSKAQVSAIRTVFPPNEWDMAMEVAVAESGGNNNARGAANERGLFQIHPVNWQNLGVDEVSLQDPLRNAEAAYKLWHDSGWQPWTTAPIIRNVLGRQR